MITNKFQEKETNSLFPSNQVVLIPLTETFSIFTGTFLSNECVSHFINYMSNALTNTASI